MSEPANGIVPLFRSDAQSRLLAQIFNAERWELSVTELARRTGVPQPTASREIARLEAHDIVRSRTIGRVRLVSANWDLPWATDLAAILAKTVGLPAQLGTALRDVAGIETAFIYGSWAERYAGAPGVAPHDIDVIVVGDADIDAVRAACREVEAAVGLEINPIVVPSTRWFSPAREDGFIATVRDRAVVEIPFMATSE